MDQDFSDSRLREIWDQESRKGRSVPRRLIDHAPNDVDLRAIFATFQEAKILRERASVARRSGRPTEVGAIRAEIETVVARRDRIIDEMLRRFSASIGRSSFRLSTTVRRTDGKYVYGLGSPYPENYFTEKLIQENLKTAFSIKPANREMILEQLLRVLADTRSKVLVRGDVRSFYDSIPHQPVMDLLRSNPRLSMTTCVLIQDILDGMGPRRRRSAIGLPRGLGISAALSEIYMKSFDDRISSMAGCIFYARYVDDIVAVFAGPDNGVSNVNYLDILRRELVEIELTLSPKKKKQYEEHFSSAKQQLPGLEFLGYVIRCEGKDVHTRLSHTRLARISQRIASSFKAYRVTLLSSSNPRKAARAEKMLTDRIRFLTSNTRLQNGKGHAHVGIYASNRHLTDTSQLILLDRDLSSHIASLRNSQLRSRLAQFSFVEGFDDRRFVWWRPKALSEITALWRRRES